MTGGGKDDRPPVLLFHAGVTDRRSWAPLVEALGPGHSTIDFDRRGFGETRYQPEPHSHVNDALAVLDATGAGSAPVTVVGASMGGQAALDLALAHPERVAALVLIGSAVRGAPRTDPADLPSPSGGCPRPSRRPRPPATSTPSTGSKPTLAGRAHRARRAGERGDPRAVPRHERHRAHRRGPRPAGPGARGMGPADQCRRAHPRVGQ
jgi:pimeloyl-ACP methyl ester carboxylesterase